MSPSRQGRSPVRRSRSRRTSGRARSHVRQPARLKSRPPSVKRESLRRSARISRRRSSSPGSARARHSGMQRPSLPRPRASNRSSRTPLPRRRSPVKSPALSPGAQPKAASQSPLPKVNGESVPRTPSTPTNFAASRTLTPEPRQLPTARSPGGRTFQYDPESRTNTCIDATPTWREGQLPDGRLFYYATGRSEDIQFTRPPSLAAASAIASSPAVGTNPVPPPPPKAASKLASPPPTWSPQDLEVELRSMQRKIDEAAQWRSTKAPCGNVYWYSVVSSATAWDKPPVYAEVKSIEFNQRLNDLQTKWKAARSQGPAQPSPRAVPNLISLSNPSRRQQPNG